VDFLPLSSLKPQEMVLVPVGKTNLCAVLNRLTVSVFTLKVPKREIFDRSDFSDFYTIKSSWVGDLLVKILTYFFNF
jgi:hypothetical protein